MCSTSGTGVLPDTDPDMLTRLVELVHNFPRQRDAIADRLKRGASAR